MLSLTQTLLHWLDRLRAFPHMSEISKMLLGFRQITVKLSMYLLSLIAEIRMRVYTYDLVTALDFQPRTYPNLNELIQAMVVKHSEVTRLVGKERPGLAVKNEVYMTSLALVSSALGLSISPISSMI